MYGSWVGFWVFWVFSGQVTEPLDFSSSQQILTKILSGQILTITYPKVFVDLRKNLMAQLSDLRKLKKPKTQPIPMNFRFASKCWKIFFQDATMHSTVCWMTNIGFTKFDSFLYYLIDSFAFFQSYTFYLYS